MKVFLIFLMVNLYFHSAHSQLKMHELSRNSDIRIYQDSDSISIKNSDILPNKIKVYAFVPCEINKTKPTKNFSWALQKLIMSSRFDTSNFFVYIFRICSQNGVCLNPGSVYINGHYLSGYYAFSNYIPYHILIDSSMPIGLSKFHNIVNDKLIFNEFEQINKERSESPFYIVNDGTVLLRILTKYNSQNIDIQKIDNNFVGSLLDSENFIRVNYDLPTDFTLGNMKNSNVIKDKKIYPGYTGGSFSCNYFKNNIKSFKWGAGIAIKQDIWSFDLSYKKLNSNDTLTEFISPQWRDIDGDSYTRVAYGIKLKETINIESWSIIPQISCKWENPSKSRFVFMGNGGVSFTNISTATYQATAGKVKYRGQYYQYDSVERAGKFVFKFDDIAKYGYDSIANVFPGSQKLKIKNEWFSLYLSGSIGYRLGGRTKSWLSNSYIQVGGFADLGLTGIFGRGILDNNSNETISSYDYGDYSSLLYKESKVQFSSFGGYLGLMYKF